MVFSLRRNRNKVTQEELEEAKKQSTRVQIYNTTVYADQAGSQSHLECCG